MFANFFRFANALINDDFPTFERPTIANSSVAQVTDAI